MRFLIDENLSEELGALLESAGHQVAHVRTIGLKSAPDTAVLARAADENSVLLSADTDFSALLAASHGSSPSIIQLRHARGRSTSATAELLLANLDVITDDLTVGAIVVIEDSRIRIRRLPL